MTASQLEIEQVLRSLVGRAHEFEAVDLHPRSPSVLHDVLRGETVDEVLRDAHHEGLIVGNRIDYGQVAHWTVLRLTVQGLRWLGEWPPPGLHHLPGPWDDGLFGRQAKPLLQTMQQTPPRHGFVSGPVWGRSEEEWDRWRTLHLLLEADLVSAREHENSLNDLRLTPFGRDVLDPPEHDPLDLAARKLATGAKIEAMIVAVEKAVGPHLRALANAANVSVTREDGKPRRLAEINNSLKKAGVLSETERTVIEGMLKRRNDCGHGDDALVSSAQAEMVIAEARVLLEEHPAP